ncbi:TPA: 50S ribosomal protein L25, partial [Mannheimia haemolytica]|nr:50S ribosomal protein L25 [Mannheimia haemolytica]
MSFKFEAEVRSAQGKGASRRLRHNGQVPAIIYGGNAEPVSIILDHDKVNNA